MMARPLVAIALLAIIVNPAAQTPAELPIASALSHIPAAVAHLALEGELPALDRSIELPVSRRSLNAVRPCPRI